LWLQNKVRTTNFFHPSLLLLVLDLGSGIRDKHPGSAILCERRNEDYYYYYLRCGDWLLFLCPGKRELPGDHLDILEPPPSGSLAEIFRSTLRQADISFKHLELCLLDIKPKEAFLPPHEYFYVEKFCSWKTLKSSFAKISGNICKIYLKYCA
jgi:hypothetical protein